jgi:hypothetical protein
MAAAALASLAALFVALTVSASSPASALAAARRALAATAAASSGTMTVTSVQGGSTWTLGSTRWHGSDIALSDGSGILGRNRQLLLIGGGVYVQRRDGRWLHYANENKVGQLSAAVQLARANVAGNTAQQVLVLTSNVRRTAQRDGTTVYTGTIPTSNPVRIGNFPTDGAIVRLVNNLRGDGSPPVSANPYDRHPGQYRAIRLEMAVGSNGLVKGISLTVRPSGGTPAHVEAPATSRVTYTELGTSPAITPPAKSTLVPPVSSSPGPACAPPPHGPCSG